MDSGCQSGIREIHQKSESAILQRFLRILFFFFSFLREDVVMSHLVRARSFAALMSLG
jgi:hypothetical protein